MNRALIHAARVGRTLLLGWTLLSAGSVGLAAGGLGEEFSGGETTVLDDSRAAFSMAARNLTEAHRASFFVGHSFFNENWVAAPSSVVTRQGLGPLFVNRSCSACHFKDGRSAPFTAGLALETMVVRIAVPGTNEHGGPQPDPVYGTQLQTRALPRIPPEAGVMVTFDEVPGRYADGEAFSLRHPHYTITNLGYGPLASNVSLSVLAAPSVFGLGLLEAVPDQTIRQLAARKDESGDGIAGQINMVWDVAAKRMAPGRFGWKAEQPSIAQQCALAFSLDMGLTTELFPHENYTETQKICATMPSGGHPEVSPEILNAVILYCHNLAVPARRNWTNENVVRGGKLFRDMNCSGCHVARLETRDWPDYPELSRQTIHPYTDLLVHDMGDELADGRSAFLASGHHWRTAPLWGIGLVQTVNNHTLFLHDGRARNLAEAILAHGGEAEKARERFRHLSKPDREAVIAFLNSI